MKWITGILLAVAALLLILPSMLLGSYWYALAVAIVAVSGAALLRSLPQSNLSNLLLIANSAMATAALFLGVHPLFAIVAIALFVYAWNAGHRFGHLDRAPVEESAKQRFIVQILVFSLIPSFGVGLLLTVFLYVQFPMSFGLGLALSTAVFLAIALFIGFTRIAQRQED